MSREFDGPLQRLVERQGTLPGCMAPDGADPCEAYKQLQAENENLRSVLKKWLNDQMSAQNIRELEAQTIAALTPNAIR